MVNVEIGQLVNVRRRQWLVANISQSSFESNQQLVSLASIDEDGLGEELEVIWGLSPGRKSLNVRACHQSLVKMIQTPSTLFLMQFAGVQPPMPTEAFCRLLSAAASALRTSSLTRWYARLTWPASICSSPMTSAWARPLRPV